MDPSPDPHQSNWQQFLREHVGVRIYTQALVDLTAALLAIGAILVGIDRIL